MINRLSKKECCGCSACVDICPVKCISMVQDQEGFYYPSIQNDRCIRCNKCENVCQYISNKNVSWNPVIWGAKSKNNNLLINSTSGAIFPELAKEVISREGVVWGVSMSEDCRYAKHIKIDNLSQLHLLQGSKYLQSQSFNIYPQVKETLQHGEMVLFSGTSCQIRGLKNYLNKDYSNLICVDVICHGVTSEKLWQKYLEFIETKYKQTVSKVYFRNKKYSWKNFSMFLPFLKGKNYCKLNFIDPYFRLFNSSLALRESCYNCKAKAGACGSDISLGDFWGGEKINPIFFDRYGVSLVIINTERGKNLLNCVLDNIIFFETDNLPEIQKCNAALTKSMERDPRRDHLYNDLNILNFRQFAHKYSGIRLKDYLKSFLIQAKILPFNYWGGGMIIEFNKINNMEEKK